MNEQRGKERYRKTEGEEKKEGQRGTGGGMASLILEQRVIPCPLPRLLKINFALFKHPLLPRDHCWMDQSRGERGIEGGRCLATVI